MTASIPLLRPFHLLIEKWVPDITTSSFIKAVLVYIFPLILSIFALNEERSSFLKRVFPVHYGTIFRNNYQIGTKFTKEPFIKRKNPEDHLPDSQFFI
jgi:hypothetical protein